MKFKKLTINTITSLSIATLAVLPIVGAIPVNKISKEIPKEFNIQNNKKRNRINDSELASEIIANAKVDRNIVGSQKATIIHSEQSYHNTPNNVTNPPTGRMSFSYKPYMISSKRPNNLNDLLSVLNSSQKKTLKYDISGYKLSVDKKYIGNVVIVPMYADAIEFTRRSVTFEDTPTIMIPEHQHSLLDTKILPIQNGFASISNYKSNDMHFMGMNLDPFVDTHTKTSCGAALCSHNIIDWVQITTGILLGGVIGGGLGLITNPGPVIGSILTGNIAGVIIPLITGAITSAISAVIAAVGGLQGEASGKCSTLSSVINVYNTQNIYNDKQEKEVGLINSFDFTNIFSFQNVNNFYNSSTSPVWNSQDLSLGFNKDIVTAMKYLSDYASLYKGIKEDNDKLMTITNGKYGDIANKIDKLIFSRKTSPDDIQWMIEKFVSLCEVGQEQSVVNEINSKLNNQELTIFEKYREAGAEIPSDINDWGFVYDVALPSYLQNDILCDIQYNGSEQQTIKLWDSQTGFQDIQIQSRENSNIANIKLSNMRFANLDSQTYTGLSVENCFKDQENVIKGFGFVDYYLLYRSDARNVSTTNFDREAKNMELPIGKYLLSKLDPINNGVIHPTTYEINNIEEINEFVRNQYIGSDNLPLFDATYSLEIGQNFSNWEKAKDKFRINGMNAENDLKKPTNTDICYRPRLDKGLFYTILEIKNFNDNDNLSYVQGDFTASVREKLLNSDSIIPLEKHGISSQFFLARMKTDKITSIKDAKIVNTKEIEEFYLRDENWVQSDIIFNIEHGKFVYIWDDAKTIEVKFEPITFKCEIEEDALELLYSSKYNKLLDNKLVTKEIVGYDINDFDEIDYNNPIYEYILADGYQLIQNGVFDYQLINTPNQRIVNESLSFNVSFDNFNEYITKESKGRYSLKETWTPGTSISATNYEKEEPGLIKKIAVILGMVLGATFLILPFIIFFAVRKQKKNNK